MFCLERKAALSFAVLMVLGLGFSAPPVSPATAQPLYINSDYTFTSNITRPIVVNASNIVIDGNGYSLQGPGSGTGFYLYQKSNVTIKNVKVDRWNCGFNITFSSGNTISSNTITGNTFCGIWLDISNSSTVSGNTIANNDWYGISLYMSNSSTVSGNTIANNGLGIILSMSNSSTVSGNTVKNNSKGIWLFFSVRNNVSGNTVTSNGYGIDLDGSSSNTVSGNNITNNNVCGIRLLGSDVNNVSGNTVTSNGYGIILSRSVGNDVSGNTMTNNYEYGIYLWVSGGNVIYHNNIISNTVQASDDAPTGNDWYHPMLLEGNYWSDYPGVDDGSGIGKHNIAGDGIGDTNISWPGAHYDDYPFVFESGWTFRVVTFSSSGLGGDGSGTVLTVDGFNYSLNDLPETFNWPRGSQHSFEWTSNVPDSPDKRYLWASTTGLSTERNSSITVPDRASSVQATYKTQYYLTVNSPYGSPTGQGWHDYGLEAAIGVEPAVPMEGLLGTLGARWVFSQWTGDLTSTSPSATVPMDKPAHVQAIWAEDYSMVYLDIVAIAGLLAALFLLSRKEIWERIIAWLKSQFST